jgi:hypothetical protein
MIYGIDENGQEILYNEDTQYQTMMEWEKPYMESLIDNLEPTGDVLEIGFGLGYSADRIQTYDIKSHTIIEVDPVVLEKLHIWAKKQKHPVNIIEGSWQQKLSSLGKFDTIFFDDAPLIEYAGIEDNRFPLFYFSIAKRHVNEGCKFSFYGDAEMYFLAHTSIEFSCKRYSIQLPEHATYIPQKDKHKNLMYLPMIKFPYGIIDNLETIAVDNYFNMTRINLPSI